ncbi:MAG: hypothetical protein JJT88_15095 [Gammaproteobacteria bacterium]|nr:hypothetical protein [Gammaproteobacteria bacterium]
MLYALPDHEVMNVLLPGISERRLSVAAAREALVERPGLVPIAIEPGTDRGQGHQLYFADIGEEPFLEWKYIYTIERLAKERRIDFAFTTDFALLDSELPVDDGLDPDGLLFHVSRCGSTLFCKALARVDSNLIINQGGPLQSGFWAALTDHWRQPLTASAENLARFRRLLRLMTRRRRPEYERSLVKFISWNTVCVEFIRAAFPAAQALYLYREPAEVIATVLQETTAALHARGTPLADALTGLPAARTRTMGDVEFLAHCYARYFAVVAEHAESLALSPVNFRQMVQRENLAPILKAGLGWVPRPEELARMQAQFDYYSKDDSNSTRYSGEAEDLLHGLDASDCQTIADITAAATRTLDHLPRNLFPMA